MNQKKCWKKKSILFPSIPAFSQKAEYLPQALSSLRGLRGAPEVPPLCRETSVSRTANVGTVGMNGLMETPLRSHLVALLDQFSHQKQCCSSFILYLFYCFWTRLLMSFQYFQWRKRHQQTIIMVILTSIEYLPPQHRKLRILWFLFQNYCSHSCRDL